MVQRKYNSIDEVPDKIREKLKSYFSDVGGKTFVIHGLPPEVTGAALARYSRAQTGIQLTIVNEFLDENGNPSQEKGSEMMDRVLNAFGDESVGELEGAHMGIEDISQLGTKEVEDRRIGGSPIEQSTRYVKNDRKDSDGKWRYLRPLEVIESGLLGKFEKVNDCLFEVYSEGIRRLTDHFKKEFPRGNFKISVERMGKGINVSEEELQGDLEQKAFNNAYNFTIRGAALDVGRCVLPASALTNLGFYGNGRFITNLITHLKSGDLNEFKERGYDIEREVNKIIPTFIKRNRENPHIAERNNKMRDLAWMIFHEVAPEEKKVTLVPRTDYLDEIISSSLFPYTDVSLKQITAEVSKMPYEKKMNILDKYIGKRETRRDRSGRGLEAGYPLTFDIIGTFAEYRDLERHRMLTQQRQMLTTSLGFGLPNEMEEIGMKERVKEAVGLMEDLNSEMRHMGLHAASQYATLFNHYNRFMFGMNMREIQHMSELRTQPAGHIGYRWMLMEMTREVNNAYPWAKKAYEFVNYSDPNNKIARAKEQSRIAGKNLVTGISGDLDL